MPQFPHPARPRTTEPHANLRWDPMWRFRTAAPRRRPPAPLSGRQQAPRGAARGPKPGRKPAKSGIFLPSAPRHPDPQLPTEEHARRRARSHPSAPKRVRKQGRARQTHLCTERNQGLHWLCDCDCLDTHGGGRLVGVAKMEGRRKRWTGCTAHSPVLFDRRAGLAAPPPVDAAAQGAGGCRSGPCTTLPATPLQLLPHRCTLSQ